MKPEYRNILRNYQDRKKMKWAGFYLSDHTARIDKDTAAHYPVCLKKERMGAVEIDQILSEAKIKDLTVCIQKEEIDLEHSQLSNIEGKISGYDEAGIFIGDKKIFYEQIRHVAITDSRKWSAL